MQNHVKNRPFFSVICPIYNSELFLKECIKSVIDQTFLDWELILVDDGSTDNSLSICTQFKKTNNKIKIFKSDHKGTLIARNLGIKHSNGKYLLFLDSDDYFNLDTLEKCYKNLVNYKFPDFLIFNFSYVNSDGTQNKKIFEYQVQNPFIKDHKKIIEFCIFPNKIASLNIKAIKKSIMLDALKLCDFKSLLKLRHFEDYLVSFFVVKKAKHLLVVNDSLYNYRINPSSTTHNLSHDDYIDTYMIIAQIYKYIYESDILNKEGIILLEKKYFRYLRNTLMSLKHLSYNSFFHYVQIIRNEKYLNIIFSQWESFTNFNKSISFNLLKDRKYFKLWCQINLNCFRWFIRGIIHLQFIKRKEQKIETRIITIK